MRRLLMIALLIVAGSGAGTGCEDDSAYKVGQTGFQNDMLDAGTEAGAAADGAVASRRAGWATARDLAGHR